MAIPVASTPRVPSAGRLRRLSYGIGAAAQLLGLGFVAGNFLAPRLNLREMLSAPRATPAPTVHARPSAEDLRKGLAAAESKLREQSDQKRREVEDVGRAVYLMERQRAPAETLARLRQQADQLRRDAAALHERLAEVHSLAQGLGRADGQKPAPGQAREQEELDELTTRARLWLEFAGR